MWFCEEDPGVVNTILRNRRGIKHLEILGQSVSAQGDLKGSSYEDEQDARVFSEQMPTRHVKWFGRLAKVIHEVLLDRALPQKLKESAEDARCQIIKHTFTMIDSTGSALEHVIGMGAEQVMAAYRLPEGWLQPDTSPGLLRCDIKETHVFGASATMFRDRHGAIRHLGNYVTRVPTGSGMCDLICHGNGTCGSLSECLAAVSQFAEETVVKANDRSQCVLLFLDLTHGVSIKSGTSNYLGIPEVHRDDKPSTSVSTWIILRRAL